MTPRGDPEGRPGPLVVGAHLVGVQRRLAPHPATVRALHDLRVRPTIQARRNHPARTATIA